MEVCALGVCLVHLRLSSCNIIATFVSELQFPFVIDIESNSLTKYMCNLVNMHPFYNAHLNSSSELFSFLFFFFFLFSASFGVFMFGLDCCNEGISSMVILGGSAC